MDFPPNDQLFAALKRRVPQMATSRIPADGGSSRVQVTYRDRGPAQVAWDGSQYVWMNYCGPELGTDAEAAADLMASAMGAAPRPPETGI